MALEGTPSVTIIQLARGMKVRDSGAPAIVLYANHSRGGGAGMGESPESWRVVLSDGRVLSWDVWQQKSAPSFELLDRLDLDGENDFGSGRI